MGGCVLHLRAPSVPSLSQFTGLSPHTETVILSAVVTHPSCICTSFMAMSGVARWFHSRGWAAASVSRIVISNNLASCALCQMCHFLLRMAPPALLFMQFGSQPLSLMSLILVHNRFRWLRSLLTAASAKALQHNFEGVDGDHTNQRLQHMCQRRFLSAARVQNGLTNSRRRVVLGALRLSGLARR